MPDNVDILKAAPALPVDPLRHATGYPKEVELGDGLYARIDVQRGGLGPSAKYVIHIDFADLTREIMADGLALTTTEADTLTRALIVARATAVALNAMGSTP